MSQIRLRPWQSEAVGKALNWLTQAKGGRHFLINAAPGAGKTICASVIAAELLNKDEIDRVIVIAPRSEVVRQWADEYRQVTGRHMSRVTGAEDVQDYGVDLCATWAAIQGLLDGFQQVCRTKRTLIICDEHHHAAVEAAWGESADSAFREAKYVLVLSGTPIRSDGQEPIWFAYDSLGRIDHPDDGTYTLTYGDAVDLQYCRPITFHRHEGRFTVSLTDRESVTVSGENNEIELADGYKRVKGLQQALDFYKLACTPKYQADGKTPDINSYQASMLEWGILKLNDLRDTIPNAGGLVIAPNIEVAEYMASLLEAMEGEKPILVHSQMTNAEGRIAAFKNTDKKWLVSVAMISEGVDIKRLRILVYLPYAQTELAFRQAMGRVVRSLGNDDISRAYVVMPTHRIFDEYARRVEQEMSPAARSESSKSTNKVCPTCEAQCEKNATTCHECGHEFPPRQAGFKTCDGCSALNPLGVEQCQECGKSFHHDFEITLNEALRVGAIARGMDLGEEEVRDAEANREEIRARILSSGDDKLINLIKLLPEETFGRLKKILNTEK